MSIKKNSFKIFSFSCFLFISSCSTNVAKIEGTSNFSTIQSNAKTFEYHTVNYGDSLWSISLIYYGNPFYWPNIYKNNTNKIYDADLILPGQSIIIHKNISSIAKGKAESHARNRGLWVVGYREESDIKFLENN
jgi:hypothetical protein|tara:strand:- start:186 stop:587 length:402 start_codon:yes stop_codon:yes gene_type:complete